MKLYSKKIKIFKYYLAFIIWYIPITLNKTITLHATPTYFVISVLPLTSA